MTDLEMQSEQGKQAGRILADEVFRGAVLKVEAFYLNEWRASAPEEVAKREQAYVRLHVLADVLKEIRIVMSGGQVADATIRRNQKRS